MLMLKKGTFETFCKKLKLIDLPTAIMLHLNPFGIPKSIKLKPPTANLIL
jgi:hypothetical protein